MVTSPEKVTLPGGGDFYDYVEEMRKMAASQRTIVPVADLTEADAIAVSMAAEGRPVSDANPLVVRDLSLDEINVKDSNGWQNTAWQALTLAGVWVPYVGGGNYYNGLRCRRKDGAVLINGMVKSGAAGSIISTLPAGHIPANTVFGFCQTSGGVGTILISTPTGDITYATGSPASPTYVNISLSFPLT